VHLSDEEIAKKHNITVLELKKQLKKSLELLSKERKKRDFPRLDDKVLTSWNGLMLKGLVDAAKYLKNDTYLTMAQTNAKFILENLVKPDGSLYHNHKEGTSTINAYLEDYASVIAAFIGLYEITFDEKWLLHSKSLTEYCIKNFYDDKSNLFFFSSKQDPFVIRRTAIVGEAYQELGKSILANYIPNSIVVGSKEEGEIELLKNRYNEQQTLIYVCVEGACKLPVTSAEQAINQL